MAHEVLILAGPNGAGKTTSSRVLVPDGMVFVNADVIAGRLADEGHPPGGIDIAAGRVVLAQMRALEEQRASFCLETNLAGRGMLGSIKRWHAFGYRVGLVFVALHSDDLAVTRVARRVAQGGHDIPEAVIRRRWYQGLSSFFSLYREIVDSWMLIDNSEAAPVTVARGSVGQNLTVHDRGRWDFYRVLADRR